MTPDPFEKQPLRKSAAVSLRPKDAATLLLVDRSGETPRVLMGRRGGGHVFMPDVFVFPGGRRDRSDAAMPFQTDLHPQVLERLASTADAVSVRRARGIAMAAIRELHEETGLVIGQLERTAQSMRLSANLQSLRYVARAITPPGNVRRFDTRFFLTFCRRGGNRSHGDPKLRRVAGSAMAGYGRRDEPENAPDHPDHLDDVKKLMSADPSLPFGSAGPFYYLRHGRLQRGSI